MPNKLPLTENALTVQVPRYGVPVVPVTPDRVRRLRQHLVKALREAREATVCAGQTPTAPTGHAALVASMACRLCEGWCCRHGGDDAYLDGPTMARVRMERPDLDARSVIRLYVDRAPAAAKQGSCIFHGAAGCTLDRSMRADICNSFFCRGLSDYLAGAGDRESIVIAGEEEAMRFSKMRSCVA